MAIPWFQAMGSLLEISVRSTRSRPFIESSVRNRLKEQVDVEGANNESTIRESRTVDCGNLIAHRRGVLSTSSFKLQLFIQHGGGNFGHRSGLHMSWLRA